MQQESRLWKLGGQEGRELLTRPEITLKEARIVGQCLFIEEKDEMGNWPLECSQCWPRVFPAQIPGAGTQESISS
ncbi:putative gametoproteintin-binding protein 1 [Saguinus oedipus]|uniref:Gametoproteintin-binding protein 1 n=1 Tax=Saguinus oedipus TaxID=9490 RepID=A0ABQ9VVW1_SAGOE|nr:putative gametoproteintin-binding protein 1 [Saguinus oedipus]